MDTNIRTVKITLVGHYWDLIPEYVIHCDEIFICRKEIPTPTGIPYTEEFEHSGDISKITIRFKNKSSDQTVLNLSYSKILRDMLLELQSIVIDDKSINLYDNTVVYKLDQKQNYQGELVSSIKNATCMGWRGMLEISIPLHVLSQDA